MINDIICKIIGHRWGRKYRIVRCKRCGSIEHKSFWAELNKMWDEEFWEDD